MPIWHPPQFQRSYIYPSLSKLLIDLLSIISFDCNDFLNNISSNIVFGFTAAISRDPSVFGKYRAGFSECMSEVTSFLSTCGGVNTEIRSQLLSHLAGCVSQINTLNFSTQCQIPTYPPHPAHPLLAQAIAQIPNASPQLNGTMPCKSGSPINLTSEMAKLYSGLQIVSATDGQFAFLIPSAALAHMSVPNALPGNPTVAVAVSPVVPPITADSVWRPW